MQLLWKVHHGTYLVAYFSAYWDFHDDELAVETCEENSSEVAEFAFTRRQGFEVCHLMLWYFLVWDGHLE